MLLIFLDGVQFRLESSKLLSDDDFILGNGEAQFDFRSMIISFLVFTSFVLHHLRYIFSMWFLIIDILGM
jgi:hypothetical protein